jgi:hypothetical protein
MEVSSCARRSSIARAFGVGLAALTGSRLPGRAVIL